MATTTPLLRSDRRPGRERRRAPRYVLRRGDARQAKYHAVSRGTRVPLSMTGIHDISEGGLSFTTRSQAPPRAGELIGIDFALPDFGPLVFQGKVVRLERESDHLKVGVEFQDLSEEYRELLRAQVEQRLKEAIKAEAVVHHFAVADMPHLRSYLLTVKDILIALLCVFSAYLIFTYVKRVNDTTDWVNDAYKFFSRIKAHY